MKRKKQKKEEHTENNSKEVQNQEEAQSDLQKFVASALRQPRGGIYEHLLSQILVQAVIVTDRFKRIKIVTEACLTVREPERENLAIDYEKVDVLNLVANAFLSPSICKPQQCVEVVSLPWGFPQTEENFKTFILPWFTCGLSYWPGFLTKHVETWKIWECRHCGQELARRKHPYSDEPKIPRKCPRCKDEVILSSPKNFDWSRKYNTRKIVKDPSWSFFFEVCQFLSPEGYDLLRSNFAAWAIPQVQLYLAELTEMVSPSLYESILGLYKRDSKRSYAEKVKEATKPVETRTGET